MVEIRLRVNQLYYSISSPTLHCIAMLEKCACGRSRSLARTVVVIHFDRERKSKKVIFFRHICLAQADYLGLPKILKRMGVGGMLMLVTLWP